jgi:small subunit ribosomal protein S11
MAEENILTPVIAAAPAEAAPAPAAPAVAPTTPAPAAAPAVPAERQGGDRAVSQSVWLEIGGESAESANKVVKSKGSKNVHSGIVHVVATFNNTLVTITDRNGNSIGWSTAGKMGFKGSRKGTAYAAQVVSQDACRQAMGHGLKEVEVRLKGTGSGRESAVRALQALGVEVTLIKDVTPMPHNGCRPPKARRV